MTLQGLAAAGRVDELRRQAHTIKGLAATLGAAGLARSAAAAERIWSGEPAAAEAHAALQRWLVELEAAVPALRALCDDLQSEAPPAVDDGEPLAEVLQALASHLADADMEALAVLDRLRAAHAGRLGDRFAPLEQAVTQLDFEHALDLCRNLMEARDS
jgi:two-component system sensor histidine kinase/response regulator